MKKPIFALLLLASLGTSLPALAAEPSLHEVYQAANSGHLNDAQQMMHEVLQAHPNSGKAHYVEAELLAKQGQLQQASTELTSAEKLAPGLPFADSHAVSNLKSLIKPSSGIGAQRMPFAQQLPAASSGRSANSPWGLLLLGGGLIAFIFWAMRFMSRRNGQSIANGPTQPGFGYPPAYPSPAAPYGSASSGGSAYGPAANAGSGPGLGSQVLGGLATGAAVGAGVVAGEALMHHFIDGNRTAPATNQNFGSFDSIPSLPSTPFDDMGGNDFGIADSGSWDDSGSVSDSDWN